MDNRLIRLKNLQYAIERAGGVAHLAEFAGCSEKYLRQIVQGFQGPKDKSPRKLGDKITAKIAEWLEVEPYWMDLPHEELWGEDAPPSDAGSPVSLAWANRPPLGYVRLEHLSPQPSMGQGAVNDEPVQIVQHLDVLERWVRQEIGTPDPTRIKILTGNGTSMSPTINDQDLVFVDIECRSIEMPGIYVLDVAGRFILKKAMILGNGMLVIRSDNTAEYPDEERYDLRRAGDSITVCGKVMAWWTLRKG